MAPRDDASDDAHRGARPRPCSFPGLTNAWTMPIKTRIDMLSTGIKTPVGIKIVGPDLRSWSDLGEEVEAAVRSCPGRSPPTPSGSWAATTSTSRSTGEAAARYGLTVGDVQDVIQTAIGGMNVTWTVEGLERYPVNVRYPRELRDNLPALRRDARADADGAPRSPSASSPTSGHPPGPARHQDRRTPGPTPGSTWTCAGSTSGPGWSRPRATWRAGSKLPAGYTIFWSGQYEYMERREAAAPRSSSRSRCS